MKLPKPDRDGPSEALREAIERTFEATVESAAGTKARAGELLDQVVDRLGRIESAVRREARKRSP
jgi:hypothetical protein